MSKLTRQDLKKMNVYWSRRYRELRKNKSSERSFENEKVFDNSDTTLTSNNMLIKNLLERCKTSISQRCSPYSPKIVEYETVLSPKLEFKYVMHEIGKFPMKTPESNMQIGGYKVFVDENRCHFRCSIQHFKGSNTCEFETNCIKTLGLHVHTCHPNAPWEGSCGECFSVFKADGSDEGNIFTQKIAFCHLVKEHLLFMKNPPLQAKEPKDAESTTCLKLVEYSEPQPGPSNASSLEDEELPYNDPTASDDIIPPYDMLSIRKLQRGHRCMATCCGFTTLDENAFVSHIKTHQIFEKHHAGNGSWKRCMYCHISPRGRYRSTYSTGQELCSHIGDDHFENVLQCGFCFNISKPARNRYEEHSEDEDDMPGGIEDTAEDPLSIFRCSVYNVYCVVKNSRLI